MDNRGSSLQNRIMGVDFLRGMAWLGKERVLAYLRIVALLDMTMLIVLVTTSHGGVDINGFLLGSDFISFWAAGHMLHAHADVYNAAAHVAVQREFFASADGYTAFFYPPPFLPLCWLLGFLSYFPALALWLALTGAFFAVAVRFWARRAGIAIPLWLMIAAFPPVAIVVTHGQTSFLVAALLGLGALLVPARPVLAGTLFGLATIKPQLGVLVPVVLIATREGRVFAAAAVTALMLAAITTLAFGSQTWLHWLSASAGARAAMETGAVPFGKMVTTFAAARLIGLPDAAAYALQWGGAFAVLGLLAHAGRARGYSLGLGAAMLAGAPLATPFALDYDMVLLAFPLLWLTGEGLRNGFAPYDKLAIALAFIAPVFARPLALSAGVPIEPPITAFLFAMVLRRIYRTGTSAQCRPLG